MTSSSSHTDTHTPLPSSSSHNHHNNSDENTTGHLVFDSNYLPPAEPTLSPSTVPLSSSPSSLQIIASKRAENLAREGDTTKSPKRKRTAVEKEGITHLQNVFLNTHELDTDEKLAAATLPLMQRLLPSWKDVTDPSTLRFDRISGALTNCVFIVHGPPEQDEFPTEPSREASPISVPGSIVAVTTTRSKVGRKVLLRVYGVGSEQLLVREKEISWLRRLSRLGIGARLLGTFENGRFEQYLPSSTLTAADLRDPDISAAIGARMAELHSIVSMFPPPVDNDALLGSIDTMAEYNLPFEGEVWTNIRKWIPLAREAARCLAQKNPKRFSRYADRLVLDDIETVAEQLKNHLENNVRSPVVFAHNDTQYGNILRLDHSKMLVFVDYEYAGYNHRGFDIANHFCEWTANYHSPEPHRLNPDRFPTESEQLHFLSSYVDAWMEASRPFPIFSPTSSPTHTPTSSIDGGSTHERSPSPCDPTDTKMECCSETPRVISREDHIRALFEETKECVPASHLMWALWGLVQASQSEIKFDYLEYAAQRFELFRKGMDRSR